MLELHLSLRPINQLTDLLSAAPPVDTSFEPLAERESVATAQIKKRPLIHAQHMLQKPFLLIRLYECLYFRKRWHRWDTPLTGCR